MGFRCRFLWVTSYQGSTALCTRMRTWEGKNVKTNLVNVCPHTRQYSIRRHICACVFFFFFFTSKTHKTARCLDGNQIWTDLARYCTRTYVCVYERIYVYNTMCMRAFYVLVPLCRRTYVSCCAFNPSGRHLLASAANVTNPSHSLRRSTRKVRANA